MKKVILIALSLAVLVTLFVPAVAMAKGPDGPSGKSDTGHVYLYEKTGVPDWEVVEDGPWGKFNYKLVDLEISGVFVGKGLEAETEYALVEYLGWPNVNILGTGVTNKAGNINIKAAGTLEQSSEDDYYKIWLVPTDDLTGETFNTWSYTEYLFENALINVP